MLDENTPESEQHHSNFDEREDKRDSNIQKPSTHYFIHILFQKKLLEQKEKLRLREIQLTDVVKERQEALNKKFPYSNSK